MNPSNLSPMKKYFFLPFLALLLALSACKGRKDAQEGDGKSSGSETTASESGNSTDRLIFHTGVCFGACPDYCLSVDKTGRIEFWGGIFAEVSGFYTAQASPAAISRLEEILVHPGWDTLGTEYRANWTDDRSVELIRIVNGRMQHSMYDYGAQVGGVAKQAYALIDELVQSGGFQAMEPGLLTCWQFQPTNFSVEGVTQPLTKAEMFFLWQEWRRVESSVQSTLNGPFVEAEEPFFPYGKNRSMGRDPVARYPNCLGDAPKTRSLNSNGQIFTINYDDGGQTRIDVGYPFFEENKFAFPAVDASK